MDYGRFQNIHISYNYTKSFLCSLGEISLIYNLHIEKNVVFVYFFSNPMQCPFDVL